MYKIVLLFCVVDKDEFVPKKETDRLSDQFNQLRDEYEAVKKELEAARQENKKQKEQLKSSKFGFDSIMEKNSKICFFTGLQSLQVF